MKKQVWKSGPPPSIGWWPASAFEDAGVIRWWNGKYWSLCAYEHQPAIHAGRQAKKKCNFSNAKIYWQDRPKSWPARSRT